MTAVPPFALALVLSAAVLHALWNALVKGAADRMVTMGIINLAHGVMGLVMVLIWAPPAREAWGFIAASTFIHFFYYGFLVLAYRFGDLSQVYPVARGIAPVLVAAGAQVFAGEVLPMAAWGGILLVSLGISLLFSGLRGGTGGAALAAALMTGLTIAAYTVVDGMGVRASDSALGYIGWLFVLEFIAAAGFLGLRRHVLHLIPARVWLFGLAGGFVSALAYALAIYAKSLTSIGAVSAIRESSVIFAALIGVIWFGERPWRRRVAAAAVVAGGVVVLALAGG